MLREVLLAHIAEIQVEVGQMLLDSTTREDQTAEVAGVKAREAAPYLMTLETIEKLSNPDQLYRLRAEVL